MTQPRVFVSGPIRFGRVADNLHKSLTWATWLRRRGFTVYVPHANYFWEVMAGSGSEQDWMDHDLAWLEVCDAVFRVDGYSPGAEEEVARAKALHLPVFHEHNPDAILAWRQREAEKTLPDDFLTGWE